MKYCLGTVQFGMNYGVQGNCKPNLGSVYEILDTALKNGINTFDTAMAYGDAELVLGDYIKNRNLNSKNIHIITKDKSNIDFERLLSNIKLSLTRLNIDKLYGFMYHDANVVRNIGAMNFLKFIRSNNLADKVGVSVYYPEEAIEALKYNIDIIQIPYNLFDHKWNRSDFFKKAKEKEVEIYARSSLLQGLLVMEPENLPDRMIFAKKYLIDYINICKKFNFRQLDGAIGYVSSNEYIDYIVFGTDNIKQFIEYVSLRDLNIPNGFINDINIKFSNVENKLVNPSMWV